MSITRCFAAAALLLTAVSAGAQSSEPVVMTIAGKDVPLSEFAYSYDKNNGEGVIDRKNVAEYAELFINYKLKTLAALDAQLDTMSSFKKEYRQYRDQQLRPTFATDEDIEKQARETYDKTAKMLDGRGYIHPAHILIMVKQSDPKAEQDKAKTRIDSIYAALQAGADFGALARKLSQDPGSARQDGLLPWIGPGQTFREFEEQCYALQPGQMSKPFLSPVGYHIALMKERRQLEPYDSAHANIIRFLEARNVREHIAKTKIDEIAKLRGIDTDAVMDAYADSICRADKDMRYLIQEYYDGLLSYEIANRNVWEKGAKDEAGLAKYFKKNKKKYAFDEPRFKGIAYHVKEQSDVKAVQDCVAGLSFDKWAEALRTTFNADSVLRIRVEKGLFRKGDNTLIDREQFHQDSIEVKPTKDYPIDATYGHIITKPEELDDVRGLVTADYQDVLEKAWVKELRKRYKVSVNKSVLATVKEK